MLPCPFRILNFVLTLSFLIFHSCLLVKSDRPDRVERFPKLAGVLDFGLKVLLAEFFSYYSKYAYTKVCKSFFIS